MQIKNCRLCKSKDLIGFLDLGTQVYTGIFPSYEKEQLPTGRLMLALCQNCKLVQLLDTYNSRLMYGENYGYRSSLNESMKYHLKDIAEKLIQRFPETQKCTIVDIGSNDGTFLDFFPSNKFRKVGIDPTASKFREFYKEDVEVVSDFFSRETLLSVLSEKVDLISSIAMMYDLEDPLQFVSDIYESLKPDGIWFFEQSYLGLMLEKMSYDTICHEHLEYYSAQTICKILDEVGFVVVDVELNETNGGSIAITARKKSGFQDEHSLSFQELLNEELAKGVSRLETLELFARKVEQHGDLMRRTLRDLRVDGRSVVGLGASTKGNVMLQYCGLTASEISFIGEVNEDKFGKFTPGSLIPIVSEQEALDSSPDYIVIIPWHFRKTFELKTTLARGRGTGIIFPLPKLEIIRGI